MESIVKRIKRFVRRIEASFGLVVMGFATVAYTVSAIIILLGFTIASDAYISLEWSTETLEKYFDRIMSGFLDEE